MRASRLFLSEIKARITMRAEFAFETTLAGRGHFKLIERLQGDGWRVELIYLALSNVEMSVQRVAERAAHGGHDVSLDVIRRRFPRSLHNLLLEYGPCVDRVRCFLQQRGNATARVHRTERGTTDHAPRDLRPTTH